MSRDWSVLRELAEKATPGEWQFDQGSDYEACGVSCGTIGIATTDYRGIDFAEADAKFIAAANPQVVKELIEENEKLRIEVDRLLGMNRNGDLPRYLEAVERMHIAEAERDAALAVIQAALAEHAPSLSAAGEYQDGTCAYCHERDDAMPLIERRRDYLNGQRPKVWMHFHEDRYPTCTTCAGGGYDASYADWPCSTYATLAAAVVPTTETSE